MTKTAHAEDCMEAVGKASPDIELHPQGSSAYRLQFKDGRRIDEQFLKWHTTSFSEVIPLVRGLYEQSHPFDSVSLKESKPAAKKHSDHQGALPRSPYLVWRSIASESIRGVYGAVITASETTRDSAIA